MRDGSWEQMELFPGHDWSNGTPPVVEKTISIHLSDLREQLAQEIEALKAGDNFIYDVCINIVRGNK